MTLSNYQLILLDNLIYLNKLADIIPEIKKGTNYTVEKLITDLLGNEKLNKEDSNNEEVSSGEADDKEPDNGEIDIYWKDELNKTNPTIIWDNVL